MKFSTTLRRRVVTAVFIAFAGLLSHALGAGVDPVWSLAQK